MHEPNKKSKSPDEINIYRERCRKFVAGSRLHPSHKAIILTMTDYVNRYCYEAFVGEETLAADCNTTPRSVRRAKNAAIKLGIIECTVRGNVGRASRHVFKLDELQDTFVPVPDIATGHFEPNYRTLSTQLQDTSVPRTSEITSEIRTSEIGAPPSSSALEGHSSGVASEQPNSANAVPSGARSATQKKESAEQKRGRPSEEARRQQVAAAMEKMKASGLDFSQSKLRQPNP
jgi:hypothetical protein